jgi:Actinobacteria/chloroflexi VLRF1 release factor
MSRIRELAGGGRAVEVEPERLAKFLDRFVADHGGALATTIEPWRVEVGAVDGWLASMPVPFGPLAVPSAQRAGLAVDDLIDHALAVRTIGLLLVRLGGYSVGIARAGMVLVAATGSRPVHGRSAAGGQSQQRFARRREVRHGWRCAPQRMPRRGYCCPMPPNWTPSSLVEIPQRCARWPGTRG